MSQDPTTALQPGGWQQNETVSKKQTKKLLEKNIGVSLCDLELGFLDMIPKVTSNKRKYKVAIIKIKTFCPSKDTK